MSQTVQLGGNMSLAFRPNKGVSFWECNRRNGKSIDYMHLQEKLSGIKVLHSTQLSLVRDKELCWKTSEATLLLANLQCYRFPASVIARKNILLSNAHACIEFYVTYALFSKEIFILHISRDHLLTCFSDSNFVGSLLCTWNFSFCDFPSI